MYQAKEEIREQEVRDAVKDFYGHHVYTIVQCWPEDDEYDWWHALVVEEDRVTVLHIQGNYVIYIKGAEIEIKAISPVPCEQCQEDMGMI